jgi:hypothetical protein
MSDLKIVMMAPDAITPYEKNVKNHDKEQVERIAKAITEFGFDQPIVVDSNHVIIKGHGRRLASLKLGLAKVPVLVRSDLTPDQVRAARLADNRVALGDIDTNLFREELASLDYDLEGIFDAKEIDFSTADLGEMNFDAFITNLSAEVDAQEAATEQKIEDIRAKRVPLHKVLGFRDIPGADQIHLTRFMAQVEDATGLKGEEAFVAFAKQVVAA